MMDLPDSLLITRIKSSLRRGSVLRTNVLLKGNFVFKRLIILNKDFSDHNIYFVMSTTQVAWYKANARAVGVVDHFLYFPPGQTPCNPTDEMVIDLRQVYDLPLSQLIKNLREKKLDFLPDVPGPILNDIDRLLRGSSLIPRTIKDKIMV